MDNKLEIALSNEINRKETVEHNLMVLQNQYEEFIKDTEIKRIQFEENISKLKKSLESANNFIEHTIKLINNLKENEKEE